MEELIMRKQWIAFVAVMTAVGISACGNGDGIVINGTTAAESESTQLEGSDSAGGETTSGTTIEIITGETTMAPETAPVPTEEYTQAPAQIQPETTASQPTASTTKAATQAATQPETTAAKVYKVKDVKKTMYATASVRVRASYSTGSDVLAGLSKDEKVEVTGESENGWLRVNYKGNVGYVSKDYLTETAPKTASETTNTDKPSTGASNPGTTNAGTLNPGNHGTGPTAPAAGSGGATGPGGSSNPTTNGATGPGGAASPGGSTGPGSTSPGGSTTPESTKPASGGGSSITGSVTALDPSGVTVQTSNGTSYQFVWGDSVPALAPGEKIQIFYETTSSGEKRVTSYSK